MTSATIFLRLVFTSCHPILVHRRRAFALTLRPARRSHHRRESRALISFSRANHRASASCRAKRTPGRRASSLRGSPGRTRAQIPVLSPVLEVVYISFSTKVTRGPRATTWMRPALLRRPRFASAGSWRSSPPEEPEVHGLVALMEIQASRSAARTGPSGEPILLLRAEAFALGQLLIRRRSWRRSKTVGENSRGGGRALCTAGSQCRVVHGRARGRPRENRLGSAIAVPLLCGLPTDRHRPSWS